MHDDQDELLKKLAVQEALLSPEQAIRYRRYCDHLRERRCYDEQAAISAANVFHSSSPNHLLSSLRDVEDAAKRRAEERVRQADREEAERAKERQEIEAQKERDAQYKAEIARKEELDNQQRSEKQREQEAKAAAAQNEPVPGSIERFDAALEQRQTDRLSQMERRNNADMDRLVALGPQRPDYGLLREQSRITNQSATEPTPARTTSAPPTAAQEVRQAKPAATAHPAQQPAARPTAVGEASGRPLTPEEIQGRFADPALRARYDQQRASSSPQGRAARSDLRGEMTHAPQTDVTQEAFERRLDRMAREREEQARERQHDHHGGRGGRGGQGGRGGRAR